MEKQLAADLLKEHFNILDASTLVLKESYERVGKILSTKKENLTIKEKESCEAFTATIFSALRLFISKIAAPY